MPNSETDRTETPGTPPEQGANVKHEAARCRWCGSNTDECLFAEAHDIDKNDHAPCGAYFPASNPVDLDALSLGACHD